MCNTMAAINALPSYDTSAAGRLLEGLAAENGALAFTGDSLTNQLAVGFECELLKTGGTILRQSTEQRPKPRWRYGVGTVEEWIVAAAAGEKEVPVLLFSQYRYNSASWKDMEEILERSTVIVVNFGVHW